MKKLIYLLIFIVLTNLVAATNCTSIQDAVSKNKIIAYYSFNNNCVDDDSSNNFALTGNTASLVSGKYGNACNFDGDDIGQNSDIIAAINFNDTICIATWYNNTDISNGVFMAYMFEDTDNGNAWSGMTVYNNAADQLLLSNSYSGTSNYLAYSAYTDTYGGLYHVVHCTDARGLVSLAYVNNVSIGTDFTPTITQTAWDKFIIGGDAYYSTYSTEKIDEVWIINCEINGDVVSELYSGEDFPGCIETLKNTSNMPISCSFTDVLNESFTTYDENNCGFTNQTYYLNTNSCSYCEYYPDLSICEKTSLEEDEMILAMIILWIGLWTIGYYFLQTNNDLLGGTMIILSIPVDIYFAYKFHENLILGTGFIGVAFAIMAAWTFGVFILIKRKTSTK